MDIQSLLPYIGGAIVIILLLLIVTIGYVKAPPDTAYIISGLRKKIIVGKASIKIPFLERLDKLSLKLIPIDVKTSSMVPTADYINIQVDAAVNVKVGSDSNKLELAAQNFLNQNSDYMARVAREVLEGNMREIVGRMRLDEMVSDRQKFAELVKENAMPDLAAMGLNIVSFNVQNFTDANGVIDDLGIDNISQIKKKAAIAKAEADRQANDARVAAEREIAIKNNDLSIQKAELKKVADVKQATADAAYEIEKENQRKTIEVTSADANIAKQEREVLLKSKEAEVKEKALEAEVKKQAEAEKFAVQQKADAELYTRQKEAEAKKFEIQQEAEAQRAKADADRYSREREAQGIQLVGEAEAEAIRAKGIAEAEAMDKKAEAYQKYTGAAVAEMLIKVLSDVAGKIAEPLTQIDKITVIGSGNDSSSIDSVAGNVPGVMTKLFESMKETTGIDLGEIVRANTYDAKVTRNVNFSGIPASDNDTNVVVQAADSVRKQDEKKPEKPVKPVEEKPVKKKADNDKMSWEK